MSKHHNGNGSPGQKTAVVLDADTTFTSLEFKALLREQTTEVAGLRKFCKACKQYEASPKTTYDVVKAYVTVSPECSEIFNILERGNRTVQELAAVFECLLNILVRTAGDLKESFPTTGYTISNLILQHHSQKLYQCLGVPYKSKITTVTLKLLAAMVMQGRDAASLVASQLDFSLQCFKHILKAGKGAHKEHGHHSHSVRVVYVRFALSFFISGDAKTAQKILETHGFMSCIFKSLVEDPASLIVLFLTTLRDKVIKNLAIAKTSKMRLLSEPGVLLSTARLFDWDGVMDIKISDDGNDNGKEHIQQLAYDFLFHACCPFKYGINFKDKTFGTSGKSHNHILLRFINNLPSVSTKTLAGDLVVRILEACPDLLPSYLVNFKNILSDPEPTSAWLGCCDLVNRIYIAQPDIAPAVTEASKLRSIATERTVDTDTLVKMTLPGILPPILSQTFQKRCLKHKSWQVREKILEILMIALHKVHSTFHFINHAPNWSRSAYNAQQRDMYLSALKETITESHLCISAIIHAWMECSKVESPDVIPAKKLLMQVLCKCHELFPESIPQTTFDPVKLLFGIDAKPVATDEEIAIRILSQDEDVSVSVLKLLAQQPEKYKWFKMLGSGRSPFYQLLHIVCEMQGLEMSKSCLYRNASALFKKILVANDILDEHESMEAHSWLECLPPLLEGDQGAGTETILKYLQNLCGLIVRQPYRYINLIGTLLKHEGSVAYDDVATAPPVADAEWWDSLPQVEIETEDLPMDSVESEEDAVKTMANQTGNIQPKPVSLMVAASFYNLKLDDGFSVAEKKIIDQYLSTVLRRIFQSLHSADGATSFSQLYLTIEKPVTFADEYPRLENFGKFLSLWSSETSAKWQPVSAEGSEVVLAMQNWFWDICTTGHRGGDLLSVEATEKLKDLIQSSGLETMNGKMDDPSIHVVNDVFCILLLYFDTLSTKYKDKESCHAASLEILDTMQFIVRELFAVVSKRCNADVNQREENGIIDKVAISACIESIPCKLFTMFLNNQSVKSMFLNKAHSPGGHSSTMQKSTLIAVEVVERMLSLLPDHHNSDLLQHYLTEVCEAVVNTLKIFSIPHSKREEQVHRDLVLNAFTSLGSYLAQENLEKILSELGTVVAHVVDMAELEYCCEVLCHCLESLTQENKKSTDVKIEEATMSAIFHFLTSQCPTHLYGKLIQVLTRLFETFTTPSVMVPETAVDFCCKNIDHNTFNLLRNVLQQNPKLAFYLCKALGGKKSDVFHTMLHKTNETTRLKLVPVLVCLFDYCKHLCADEKCGSVEKNASKNLGKAVLKTYRPMIFDAPSNLPNVPILSQIISNSSGSLFLGHLLILLTTSNEDSFHKALVDAIMSDECDAPLEGKLYVMNVAKKILKDDAKNEGIKFSVDTMYMCMVHVIKHVSKVKSAAAEGELAHCLSALNEAVLDITDDQMKIAAGKISGVWDKFLKQGLKYRFRDPGMLKAITDLVPILYTNKGHFRNLKNEQKDIIDMPTLKQLLTSHSQFVQVMLGESGTDVEGATANREEELVKDRLTKLYYELCRRCNPDQLSEKDIELSLGAYHCTLSFSDQNILNTLVMFERKGVLKSDLRPFLWGEKATFSFRARKNLGNVLWKKPDPNKVLDCIDSNVLESTLERFPIRRRMVHISDKNEGTKHFVNDPKPMISLTENKIYDTVQEAQQVYDPCFFLPALLDVLIPENLVDCRLFIRSGALSFLYACLASHCATVRSLAVTCLKGFYKHSESAWFPEKNLTLYLIRAVRNGTVAKEHNNLVSVSRIPSVVANFLSSVVMLSQTPSDHMYSVLHRFLLVKPQLDLKAVPEFFVLFFSADVEYKVERAWILNLIAYGIRDMGDFHAVNKKNVFQLLMSFHDSPISDNFSRRQVFQIVELACRIRGVAFHLVKINGLLSWLAVAARMQPSCDALEKKMFYLDHSKRQDNTLHILEVLHCLWETLNFEYVPEDLAIINADSEGDLKMHGRNVGDEEIMEESDCSSVDEDANLMETDSPPLSVGRKRATLVPFRIVKQTIKLAVLLLKNILQIHPDHSVSQTDCSSDVINPCCIALNIIVSCMSELRKRRRQRKLRKKADEYESEILEDDCDLAPHDVEILFQVAALLRDANVPGTMLHLCEVLSTWTPICDSIMHIGLAARCICWVLKKPFKIALQGVNYELLTGVLRWTEGWLPKLGADDWKCIKQQLLCCYGEICRNLTICDKSSKMLIECIELLNRLLQNHEANVEHGISALGTLMEMQGIRFKMANTG